MGAHRICERCYFDGEHGVFEDGRYRVPVRTPSVPAVACCFCGGLTILGIGVRVPLSEVLCGDQHEDTTTWSRVTLIDDPEL